MKRRLGGFWQWRRFKGIHGVFQRRTKNNLWHASLIQPTTFFSSVSFPPWSLFGVDSQVKRLTSAGWPLTRWVFPWAHNELATFFIYFYFSYTLNLCFQLYLLSFSFPSLVSRYPHSLFPSFSVSILAGVIDFCKGSLQLPLRLSLFFWEGFSHCVSFSCYISFQTSPSLCGRNNVRQKKFRTASLSTCVSLMIERAYGFSL